MRGVLLFIGMFGLSVVHAQTPPPPQSKDALGSAFRTACWKGDLAQVTSLFNQGAPLEDRDGLGRTPLFLACHGDPDVVKFLLAHGAKIDATENDGDFPIAHACEFGDLASAQMLLTAGAEAQLGHINKKGHTALMMAAREGRDALVSLLIDHHVDVNQNGPYGSAIWFAVAEDKQGVVELLLDAGADMNLKSDAPVDPKNPRITLLSCAVSTNDLNLIDILLAHGADINGAGEDGTTPLWTAVGWDGANTTSYLIDKGADVNRANDSGVTPLMIATACKDVSILQALLQHGTKLETTDKEGCTALMYACRDNVTPAVRFLVSQGANVNVVDAHGETALTYAGDRGNTRLVNLLKEAGATRTDLHIIAKGKASPPLSKSRLWALAVGALYAQWNGKSHGMLGDKTSARSSRRALQDYWRIHDRETLIQTINELTQGPTFTGIVGEQIRDSLSFPGIEPKLERAFQLIFLDAWWRGKTNVAWDLCRAANLVRDGVDAGYLQETEAWPLLMPIARKTQTTFHSWHEMSDNFLDGREIDANERSGDLRACGRLLLNPQEPNSPWNQLPWNTDLSGN
jgi:ankyrin repeat protein